MRSILILPPIALALAAAAQVSNIVSSVTSTVNDLVNPNSYIVTLKQGASRTALLASDPLLSAGVTHGEWDDHLFGPNITGFAGKFDDATVERLKQDEAVSNIELDGIYTILGTQTNAPWGIARLSSSTPFPITASVNRTTYTYRYPNVAGNGIDIYVVDTGINRAHVEFTGRLTWGYSAMGLAKDDDNGHGTHCAGTAAGTRWGVAKKAHLIAVKVLAQDGSGTSSSVISGFNYVLTTTRSTRRPSIVSASLGGGASSAMDAAVSNLINSGVHVVVAAGNSNVDASQGSPARVAAAITVGAINIDDRKASFSNYGPIVDIWAPGVAVISAYIGSNTAAAQLSGTSMATPHVAGLAALYLSQPNYNKTPPASLQQGLKNWARAGAVKGLPAGTPNRLAHLPIS